MSRLLLRQVVVMTAIAVVTILIAATTIVESERAAKVANAAKRAVVGKARGNEMIQAAAAVVAVVMTHLSTIDEKGRTKNAAKRKRNANTREKTKAAVMTTRQRDEVSLRAKR